ncbi:MAG TPA: ribosome biogenesis GTPase Der [Candidatus Binataceae bacterium]|nr:ribosome biogenesis GTPase Der [Candidatus Binataceae bacterium]
MTALRRDRGRAGALAGLPMGAPRVVLVGRANAGKSTMFNRIARGRRAIVSAIAGTTRDINVAPAEHRGRDFFIVDSGGLELGGRERLSERVVEGALGAVALADLVVFVIDGSAGLAPGDREAVALIRETGRPMIAAVNKMDRAGMESAAAEYYALGISPTLLVSGAHGRGVEELLDEVVARLPPAEAAPLRPPDLRLALIGRPNVGKSSLLNRLAGFERAIVDMTPGTTRDPVDFRLAAADRDVLVVDTAGIRRPARVEGELEHSSVGRAIETVRRADVLVLVVDATEGVTDQDARLASLVEREGRALVVVCNKWDLAARAGRRIAAFKRDAEAMVPFLGFAEMLFTSALTGDGVDGIVPAATRAADSWRATFQTAHLNRILAEASAAMDPPMIERRRLKLMYVTQVGHAPPRLAFFANVERGIPAHYLRFLSARFRAALKLVGTPLVLEFRRTGRTWSAGDARGNARSGGTGARTRRAAPKKSGN